MATPAILASAHGLVDCTNAAAPPRCNHDPGGTVAPPALQPLALAGLRPASFALWKTAHSRGALRRFVRGSEGATQAASAGHRSPSHSPR